MTTLHALRRSSVVVAVALVLPLEARTQVSGRVVEEFDQPVAGASVELWSVSRRLATTVTDGAGRFALPQSEAATSVSAHRMGYQTASVPLAAGELVIRLAPAPLLLEGVRVVASQRRVCPNRDSPRARQVWQAARAGYAVPYPMPPVVLRTERYEASGPREEIGVIDLLAPQAGTFTSDHLRASAVADGRLEGGAYGRRLVLAGGEHWEWAPLAWGMNPHFVLDAFGALHTLSIAAERTDAVVLAFCPTRRGIPEIEGTLTIGRDGALRSARWRYLAPGSRSEAGGEVDYLPPDAATGRLLLARRGLFWRSWYGRFHFREDRYTEWVVSPGARGHRPTLPPDPFRPTSSSGNTT